MTSPVPGYDECGAPFITGLLHFGVGSSRIFEL